MHTVDTDHWDKSDYLAFALLYLAEIDGVLEPEELRYIIARLGKDHLDHILEASANCSDIECIGLLKEMRPRFYPGEIGLDSLRLEMQELCNVDGRFSNMEHRIVDMISRQL